jgi:maltooligosyltrehalose trehalohydrolase
MGRFMQARRLPVGAEFDPGKGVHFRVWAPGRRTVAIVLQTQSGRSAPLTPEGNGYFSSQTQGVRPGDRYLYQLDGVPVLFPDPASRFQPDGPDGASEVIDPRTFAWTDHAWRGVLAEDRVVYEMHIGTFTNEGTWRSALEHLPALASLGITVLEVMPVADFPGRFGWGYDGVDLFAPTRLYGRPDDFRGFVDKAHALGMAVILDVVYNHFGPAGNYLKEFATEYFTDRYKNEWGEAINFDGPDAGPVREFFVANTAYWIEEFHLDGLRLDATQQIFDQSPDHVVAAVTRAARQAAKNRAIFVAAENEPQDANQARPPDLSGHGVDALWNDDFHHAVMVALSGRIEAYYSDYQGTPQELLSAVKWGFLYQGQRSSWQKKPRGSPALDLAPVAFVNYLQNHDQVANSACGWRCQRLGHPGTYRALTALWLLAPGTPMFFQGQEFASSSPFHFFADHHAELAKQVRVGRGKFMAQFPSVALPEMQAALPDPGDPATFERCKLDHTERQKNAETYALHSDLLKLRRHDPVFHRPRARGVDGAVLSPESFALRFFGAERDDRLIIVNLGRDLTLQPAPEPLLAPPRLTEWKIIWSSEDRRYGGTGTPAFDDHGGWRIPGHAAIVLGPQSGDDGHG